MYGKGLGVRSDQARAAALYRGVCDRGDARGCGALGFLFESGTGVAKDLAQARLYYSKGCDSKDALSCLNLGVMHENGVGIPQDPARAEAIYRATATHTSSAGAHTLASCTRKAWACRKTRCARQGTFGAVATREMRAAAAISAAPTKAAAEFRGTMRKP